MVDASALDAESWIDAAWQVFLDRGLSSIKIEPLARELGATKGSFYWHFSNRRALIDAVLERWQKVGTERLIDVANGGGSPLERINTLFSEVATRTNSPGGERTLYVDAESEGVQDIVNAVAARRIDYLADILVELGFEREEALRRSTIASAVAIGLEQLTAGTGRLPDTVVGNLSTTALRMMLAPAT